MAEATPVDMIDPEMFREITQHPEFRLLKPEQQQHILSQIHQKAQSMSQAQPRDVASEWGAFGKGALEIGLPVAGAVGGGMVGGPIGAGLGAGGMSMLSDVLLGRPVRPVSAGIEGLMTALSGPGGSKLAGGSLGLLRGTRPLAKEIATEQIAGKLMTPEALSAKQFYKAAEAKSSLFTEAQADLQKLHRARAALEKRGETAAASKLKGEVDTLTNQIESWFPGFKETQKGYHRLRSIGRAQELVEAPDPLGALVKDIASGKVVGAGGETLLRGGGRVSKHLTEAELGEVKGILAKLGKDPGSSIWRQMIEGRAAGAMVGGLAGAGYGGYAGAVEGAAAGIAIPKIINGMVSMALRHPVSRAFLKRSLQGKGLANPQFWTALGSLVTRLGISVAPPEEE